MNEDQFNTNADWLQGAKSKLSARFFFANSTFTQTLPSANLGGPISTPGFSQNADPTNFRDFSLTHTYVFSGNLTNQATLGFHRLLTNFVQTEAFKFSDIGVSVPSFDDAIPQIVINGQFSLGGNGQTFILAQNAYNFGDSISYVHGKHFFRFGGGIERGQHNLSSFHFLGGLIFLSFPDFLLGESAAQNGSPFSNVFASVDLPGLLDRACSSAESRLLNECVFATRAPKPP